MLRRRATRQTITDAVDSALKLRQRRVQTEHDARGYGRQAVRQSSTVLDVRDSDAVAQVRQESLTTSVRNGHEDDTVQVRRQHTEACPLTTTHPIHHIPSSLS